MHILSKKIWILKGLAQYQNKSSLEVIVREGWEIIIIIIIGYNREHLALANYK